MAAAVAGDEKRSGVRTLSRLVTLGHAGALPTLERIVDLTRKSFSASGACLAVIQDAAVFFPVTSLVDPHLAPPHGIRHWPESDASHGARLGAWSTAPGTTPAYVYTGRGIDLGLDNGWAVLCLVDTGPRQLDAAGLDRLGDLAALAGAELTTQIARISETEASRLAVGLAAAREAVLVLDADLRITDVSPSAARLFGWPAAELLGGTIDRLLPEDVRPYHERLIHDFAAGRSDAMVLADWRRLRARHHDGYEFPVTIAVAKGHDGVGLPIFAAAIRDAREQVALNQELEDVKLRAETAIEARARFTAHISHELRTPLNAIIGFADCLAQEIHGPIDSRYRLYTEQIRDAGAHLAALLTDVIDLSVLDSGGRRLESHRVDMSMAVLRASRQLGHLIARKSQHFMVDPALANSGVFVVGDTLACTQVVLAVLSNAVKYTPPAGTVSIDVVARDRRGMTTLIIKDSGIGIPSGDLDKIGQDYFRGSNVVGLKEPGSGLGLAICHRLMRQMRGVIRIDSEVDRGTTVWLSWPPHVGRGTKPQPVDGGAPPASDPAFGVSRKEPE